MSDDKEYKSGCRCGGMCGMCHEDAPKSKEEKIAHLEKKESKLKKMLEDGTNLQIVEVDGPDPNESYCPYDQIDTDHPGMDMDEETIKFLLNDPKHAFGHGFVIAALLLDGQEWLT